MPLQEKPIEIQLLEGTLKSYMIRIRFLDPHKHNDFNEFKTLIPWLNNKIKELHELYLKLNNGEQCNNQN